MPAEGSTVMVNWGSKCLPSEVVQANAWEVPDHAPKNSTRAVRGFVVSWMGLGEDSESFVPMVGGLEWRVRPEPEARTPEERRSPPEPPEKRTPTPSARARVELPPATWHFCDTPGCGFRAQTSADLAEHTESAHDYIDI